VGFRAGRLVFSYWRNHSLTIVLWLVGISLTGIAFLFGSGRIFDLLLGLGGALITVALFGTLSGPLRERNKPGDE
jgi:hypothetical protein